MKVLLIEDSSDVRLLMELQLTWQGYHVTVADSAESGLAAAAREKPAVVVSDLGLPGMDGIELIRRLRADPVLGATPAIALSGFGAWAQLEEALTAGYRAALIKPIEMEHLVEAIERCTAPGALSSEHRS